MRYQALVRLALQTEEGVVGDSVTAYSQPMDTGDSNALTVEWIASSLSGNTGAGGGFAPLGTSLTIALQQSDDKIELVAANCV